ncbi:MAG: DNA-3-methyladenine glycosylase I [Paraglaciecola sp.]|jgi:DNA-3-methyladenine glycosylase I
MQNAGIDRNRLKIHSIIKNAKAYLRIYPSVISFSDYIWSFVDGETIINTWSTKDDVPTSTVQSDRMAKDLKKQEFSFIGTTICYAFMQAVGLVNDHTMDCFCYSPPP